MTGRELLGKFGFDVDHKQLDALEKQLEGIKHRIEIFGAFEIAKGLFELTERFARMGEEIKNAAIVAGLAVEEFQKLTFTASLSGVGAEEMGHSMVILSRRLYEARNGSEEANKAFRQAGFSDEQVKGFKTSQDALFALSDRFKNLKDPIAKAAIGQELLGRGSAKMVGYLSQGSRAIREEGNEAQRLGLILSGPQVQALVDVEHAMTKLFAVFKGFLATIASQVAPVIKFLVDDFLEFFAANKALLDLNINNWFEIFAYWLGFVYGLVKGLTERFLDLAKAMHLEGELLPTIAKLASLALAFAAVYKTVTTVQAAIKILTALMYALNVPLAADLAVILSMAWALDQLYSHFTGKQTLLSQLTQKLGETGLLSGLGSGEKGAGSTVQNNTTGGNSFSYELHAPMTYHAQPGLPPEQAHSALMDAVRGHVDRTHREAARSLKSPIAR